MSNSFQMAKKAMTFAVAATTILWSVGVASLAPKAASAASFGDLIKGTSLQTVYYYGSDGKRYAFPNEKTFFSWYNDFSSVKTLSDEELASITLAGNVAYRPGSRWVKITSDNKVYAVSTSGKVRWIENEATAKGLAGDNWNKNIDDVPDVFFVDYTVGDSLTSASAGYEGMLWSDGTSNYLMWGGKLSKVSAEGFSANRFKSSAVLSGTGFAKASAVMGSDVAGAMANLTDAAQKVTSATYAATQNVSVSLAASSPAASTVLAGQALAHVATLTFTNPTSSEVKVKSIALKRTGVSGDSTLSNVYLFNGNTRWSDAASVSGGSLSWNDASGLLSVPAGASKDVMVKADVAGSTSGQTIGLKLNAATDVSFLGAFAASGSFPIMSATHTVASAPSGFGAFKFATDNVATPSATTVDPQEAYRVWEKSVNVENNEVYLNSIRFRNIGSVNASDVKNWKLYVDGVMKGSAVEMQDANGYVSFDLGSAPLKLNTGAHTLKVVVDVVGGSNRNITVSLRSAADVVVVDEDYNQSILSVVASSTPFSAVSAGAQSINTGSLTFTKATDSPTSDVVKDASNVVLAKWQVKASGESLKIENLIFGFASSNGSVGSLRNGAVYADGVQIGSTTTLLKTGSSGTQYNFGSSLVVVPGTPVMLELRADAFDNDGTNDLASTNTITPAILAGSFNVLRMVSASYFNSAANATVGARTIKVGSFSVSKNTSYADQTAVAPKTAYKLGSFNVVAATSEDLNLNNLNVTWTEGNDATIADITNLYLEYGVSGAMKTTNVKAAPSASSDWSVSETLAAGKSMMVNVYGDVASTAYVGTDGTGAPDTLISKLIVSATTAKSATTVTQNGNGTAVAAQKSTWTTGSLSSALDGSTPVAFVTDAYKTITAAKYKFTASNESYTVKEMTITVADATVAGVISGIELYDGTTLLGSSIFSESSNTAALVTGLNLSVPANSYKVVTAKLVLNEVGNSNASSQQNVKLTFATIKYADSQGSETTTGSLALAGNEVRVFKSVPTLSSVDLTNNTLVNGQPTDLYKFTVAPSGGEVALKQFVFNTSWATAVASSADAAMAMKELKLYNNGALVDSSKVNFLRWDSVASTPAVAALNSDKLQYVDPASGAKTFDDTRLIVSFTDEVVVAKDATATFTLRGTPEGFGTNDSNSISNDNTFSVYLAADSAANNGSSALVYLNQYTGLNAWKLHTAAGTGSSGTLYNFVWSDSSAVNHSTTTGDWINGYKVLNLDLPGETWSK